MKSRSASAMAMASASSVGAGGRNIIYTKSPSKSPRKEYVPFVDVYQENTRLKSLVCSRDDSLRDVLVSLIQRDLHIEKQNENISALHKEMKYIKSIVNLKEVKQALVEAAALMRNIDEDRLNLHEKNLKLEEQDVLQTKALSDARSRVASLESELHTLKDVHKSVIEARTLDAHNELQTALSDAKNRTANFESILIQTNDRMKTLENDTLLSLTKEMESKSIIESLGKTVAGLEQALLQSKMQISSKESELSELLLSKESELNALRSSKESELSTFKSRKESELNELRSGNENELISLRLSNESKESELSALTSTIAILEGKIESTAKSLFDYASEAEQANLKVKEMTLLLRESRANEASLLVTMRSAGMVDGFNGAGALPRHSSLTSSDVIETSELDEGTKRNLGGGDVYVDILDKLQVSNSRIEELGREVALEQKLSQTKEGKISAHAMTISLLEGRIETSNKTIMSFEAKLEAASTALSDKTAALASSKREVTELSSEIDDLEREVNAKKVYIEALNKQTSSKLSSLQEALDAANAKNVELVALVDQSSQKETILQLALDEAKKKEILSTSKIEELDNAVLLKESDISSWRNKVKKAQGTVTEKSAEVDRLKTEIGALKTRLSISQENEIELHASVDKEAAVVIELRGKIEAMERLLSASTSDSKKIAAQENTADNRFAEMDQLKNEFDALKKRFAISQENETVLHASVKREIALATQFKDKAEHLERLLSASTNDSKKFASQGNLAEKIAEIDRLKAQLASSRIGDVALLNESKAKAEALERRILATNLKVVEFEKEIALSKRQFFNQAAQLSEKERELTSAMSSNSALERELAVVRVALAERDQDMKESTTEIKELTSRFIQSQNSNIELNSTIAALNRELNSQKTKFLKSEEFLQQALIKAETRATIELEHSSHASYALLIDNLEIKLKVSDSKVEELERDLSSMRKVFSFTSTELDDAKAAVKQLSSLLISSEASESELKASISALEQKYDDKDDEIQLLKVAHEKELLFQSKSLSEMTVDLVEARTEIRDLSSLLASVQSKERESSADAAKNYEELALAKSEISELTSFLVSLQLKEGELSAENAKLKGHVDITDRAMIEIQDKVHKSLATYKDVFDDHNNQIKCLGIENNSLKTDKILLKTKLQKLQDANEALIIEMTALKESIKRSERAPHVVSS